MTPLFGVDIHPEFQAGISIEQVAKEVDFLSVKLSEGMSDVWVGMGSRDWIKRGKAAGLLCLGYHYLRPGNEAAQARLFAGALAATGVPGVLDAEAVAVVGGTTTPLLTIAGIRAFMAAATAAGAHIPLMYLPGWYHQLLGAPLLAGLPLLWQSGYPSALGSGTPAALYTAVGPRLWGAYGGRPVAVLQFTDRAQVAGRRIDANAFLGTRAEFAALITGSAGRKDTTAMIQIPATDTPSAIGSSPASWPQRNFNVGWDITGGWEGDAAFAFGVQDWPGPPSNARGYLLLASWIMPSAGGAPQLLPVDPLYTAGKGRSLGPHELTPAYRAPAGCIGVTLNYSAPGGAFVTIGRSA